MNNYIVTFKWTIQQHISEILPTILCNFRLLSWITVIFKTENNWKFRCFKGTVSYCLYYITRAYFRHKCISVRIIQFSTKLKLFNDKIVVLILIVHLFFFLFKTKYSPVNNNRFVELAIPEVEFNTTTSGK